MRVACGQCGVEYERRRNSQKYCCLSCYYKSRINYTKAWIGKHPEYMLWRGARYRAKKKGLDFDITFNDIHIPSFCPVLGIPLFPSNTGKTGFFPNSPSLDRINPKGGYTKDNVRVISCRANLLKSNASLEELEKVVADLKALS